MVFITTGVARVEQGRFRRKEGDIHRQEVFLLCSFCTHQTKFHIVKQLYPSTSTPCCLELCFPDTLKADRREPHLLLTGSAEKYLLATGGSHGPTYISPQLCLVKGSMKQFSASVQVISYASFNTFNSSICYRT